MIEIKQQMVSKGIANRVTYSGKNSKKYIVIHETANTNKGAHAQAHANLQLNGNSRQASWHYQVDNKEIIQSFEDDEQCWHAGNRSYNEQSIGIEICVNSDGDFGKAVDNASNITKYLMDKYNIPAKNVIQHYDTSGKNCPRYLRAGSKGITWNDFKAKLNDDTKQSPKPSKPKKTTKKYSGNSIVDYLNSIGSDSSFRNRKRLAVKHGIKNYRGTAAQNLQLLNILRDGATFKPKKTKPKKTVKNKKKSPNKVTLKNSASRYATGERIPSRYKNKSYTVMQEKSDQVLLKEIMSWVYKKDVTGYSTSSKKPKKQTAKSFRVNGKVKIKSSAKTYSRSSASIPSRYKNKTYTIQQVGKNDVLIKELYSWVKKSDLQ